MKNIRKLYFQNASGERIGLNGEDGIIASELSGFGFTLSPVFADLKRGFFVSTSDDSEPQSTAGFSLNFISGNPYTDYQELVNWLAASPKLQLVYKPFNESAEYLRDVDVSYLSKGEKNELGWLVVPTSLICLSPWYQPNPTELTLNAKAGSAMRFPFIFNNNLRFGSSALSDFSGIIRAAGQIPGAVLFRYSGAISDPVIRLVGQLSGTTYGICSVSAEFNASDVLELSTVPTDSHVYKLLPNGSVVDLLDSLDISTTPYFQIPVNEPCTISLESASAFSGTADLLVYYYYRSV